MPTQASDHPARPVIRRALERKALTLVQAEALAGFRQGQLARWLSGRRGKNGVFRDQLQRFVDVLEAPELFNVIPWHWRNIVFTCTNSKCRRTKKILRSKFEAGRRRDFHREANIDEATGTGTWRCQRCLQSEAGKRSPVGIEIARLRRRGKGSLQRRGKQLRKRQTRKQRRVHLKKAQEAARQAPRTEEWRRKNAVGHIRPRLAGKWGLCRICNKAAYGKPDRPVETHRDCLSKWRREHQDTFGPGLYPRRPKGQRPSSAHLADSFEICVRHLLRGEPITEPDKPGLTREFGFESKRGVQMRIDTFIDDWLPPDGRAGERVMFWAGALREAREKRSTRRRAL